MSRAGSTVRRRRRRRPVVALALSAVVVLSAACGSDDADDASEQALATEFVDAAHAAGIAPRHDGRCSRGVVRHRRLERLRRVRRGPVDVGEKTCCSAPSLGAGARRSPTKRSPTPGWSSRPTAPISWMTSIAPCKTSIPSKRANRERRAARRRPRTNATASGRSRWSPGRPWRCSWWPASAASPNSPTRRASASVRSPCTCCRRCCSCSRSASCRPNSPRRTVAGSSCGSRMRSATAPDSRPPGSCS